MLRRFLAAFAMVLLALPVSANITNVAPNPSGIVIDAQGASIATIRWRVTLSGPPGTYTVSSNSGTLFWGNQQRTAGGALRRVVNHSGGVRVVTFSERLPVDLSSARLMLASGGGGFSRFFSDGVVTGISGIVEISVRSSGASGSPSLRNFTLAFDDRSQYRVVERGAALTGFVTVTSSGRGVFDGTWELSYQGRGFRPIGRDRISIAGPRASTFESPQLPTDRPGTYQLRFVAGPGSNAGVPVISYVVNASTGAGAIGLRNPAPGASVTGATRFSWNTVPGATRYRIEFRIPGETRPIAAADTRNTRVRLRPFTLARIKGQGEITWRITAYDASGRSIAHSQERVLTSGGTFLQGVP